MLKGGGGVNMSSNVEGHESCKSYNGSCWLPFILFFQNKQALQELEKLREEDELLQQQKHELSNLLNASQRELSDLNTQMEGMRSKLKEAQTSAGYLLSSMLIQLLQ